MGHRWTSGAGDVRVCCCAFLHVLAIIDWAAYLKNPNHKANEAPMLALGLSGDVAKELFIVHTVGCSHFIRSIHN